MPADTELSSEQAHALLDILSHHEVYAEIQDFRVPGALSTYGPPFEAQPKTLSTSPSLQSLVSKFVITLPGLRDVSEDFWRQRITSIIGDLEEAELSESYDKGSIGIRKTLATAFSALVEYPVRGEFAGFPQPSSEHKDRQYDYANAEDLQSAFRDAMYQVVYGDLLDKLFKKTAETAKLEDHPPIIQAGHEFILVNMASFLHYTLIISPKGQSLLTLVDLANKLVPYTIVKQTLKIGNVATMINAMVRVVLAKVSMGSVTNWIGVTQGASEGMNLMQHIISQVLQWETRDFKSRISRIEKGKDGPSKEQLSSIKAYVTKSRLEHEQIRNFSMMDSKSIVFSILSQASVPTDMSDEQHKLCQDYLTTQLAIRDREQIVRVLCHSSPDHLTTAVRECVAAYEPLIRSVHDAVDLSETTGDFERFLRDLIKLAKLSERTSRFSMRQPDAPYVPTVGDFVLLLKKHQSSLHKFLHQIAKNGPEVTALFHAYATTAVTHFRRPSASASAAGSLTPDLAALVAALPAATRPPLLATLSAHAAYLRNLHAASIARLRAVLASPAAAAAAPRTAPPSRDATPERGPAADRDRAAAAAALVAAAHVDPGPGAFLAKWQALVDACAVTPAVASGGAVRGAGRGSVLRATAAPTAADVAADVDSDDDQVFEEAHESLAERGLRDADRVPAPDVAVIVDALAEPFRKLLAERSCSW